MYRHPLDPQDPTMVPTEEPATDALDEQTSIERRLGALNAELRYWEVPQLRVCACDPQNAQSLIDTVRALLTENERLRMRLKQMQSEASEERTVRMQQARERQALSGEREVLIREKDVLMEKLNRLGRDYREKEERWTKEREGFAKERRGWTQREDAFRGHTRALDDKARVLEEKLRRTYMKAEKEKVEYRNATFEVYQQLPQRSMQQREYQHSVTSSIEEHARLVEQHSVAVREALKEVFERLQKLAFSIDPELPLERHNPQIVELPLPPPRGPSYHDLLRKFLSVIEQRAEHLVALPQQQGSDPAEMMQTIIKLKGFQSNWEQLNESRKGIVTRILRLASEKGQLERFAEAVQVEEEETGEEVVEGEAEVEEYIRQRMDYFEREINRYDRWQAQAEAIQPDHP